MNNRNALFGCVLVSAIGLGLWLLIAWLVSRAFIA